MAASLHTVTFKDPLPKRGELLTLLGRGGYNNVQEAEEDRLSVKSVQVSTEGVIKIQGCGMHSSIESISPPID